MHPLKPLILGISASTNNIAIEAAFDCDYAPKVHYEEIVPFVCYV